MALRPTSIADLDMRRRWNLADDDPGPASLPKMLLPEDEARRLDEARSHMLEFLPERGGQGGVVEYGAEIGSQEGTDMLDGGAGDDTLEREPRDPRGSPSGAEPIDWKVDEKWILADGKYRLNPHYDPSIDITLGQAIGIPPLVGAAAALTPAAVAAANAAYRFARYGGELKIGDNLRVAPFGNRAGHPIGRWPHYHCRPAERLPNGQVRPGQSLDRHRPWEEKKEFDKSWKDRF